MIGYEEIPASPVHSRCANAHNCLGPEVSKNLDTQRSFYSGKIVVSDQTLKNFQFEVELLKMQLCNQVQIL